MSSDSDEFGSFLVGFIVGGLTGAVVSLLFAPQSGEETRALIRDKSIELHDMAAEFGGRGSLRAEAAAAEARTRAEELTKVARAPRRILRRSLASVQMSWHRMLVPAAQMPWMPSESRLRKPAATTPLRSWDLNRNKGLASTGSSPCFICGMNAALTRPPGRPSWG